jgi:hypothetical protein
MTKLFDKADELVAAMRVRTLLLLAKESGIGAGCIALNLETGETIDLDTLDDKPKKEKPSKKDEKGSSGYPADVLEKLRNRVSRN